MSTSSDKLLFKEEIEIYTKNKEDILKEIDFKDIDDFLICDSIINSLESYAADKIIERKAVQIPFIGIFKKDPVKKMFDDDKDKLKSLRRLKTKEEYREIVKNQINTIREQEKEKEREQLYFNKLKKIYKNKYDYLAKTRGIEFADMIIYAKTLFEYVPFDIEVQKMYEYLNELENND